MWGLVARSTTPASLTMAMSLYRLPEIPLHDLLIRTTPRQTCVELWMVMDALDVHLHVGEGLGVAVHVPLAQPDPQLLRPGHKKSIVNKRSDDC